MAGFGYRQYARSGIKVRECGNGGGVSVLPASCLSCHTDRTLSGPAPGPGKPQTAQAGNLQEFSAG